MSPSSGWVGVMQADDGLEEARGAGGRASQLTQAPGLDGDDPINESPDLGVGAVEPLAVR